MQLSSESGAISLALDSGWALEVGARQQDMSILRVVALVGLVPVGSPPHLTFQPSSLEL